MIHEGTQELDKEGTEVGRTETLATITPEKNAEKKHIFCKFNKIKAK